MKINRSITTSACLLAGFASLSGAAFASSSVETPSESSLMSTLRSSTPMTVSATSGAKLEGGSLVTRSSDSTVSSVPGNPNEGIKLSGQDGTVTVGLPSSKSDSSGKQISSGVVAYRNDNGTSTAAVAVNDGSVQIATIIDSKFAPTTYTYPVNFPKGGSMAVDSKTGDVSITDSKGNWIAGAAPAWAKDASGNPVKTWYTVDGKNLVQHVDLSQKGISFPVTADPYWGMTLISHTQWANTWKYSPTLKVFPTTWGRAAPPAAGGAAWTEALKKTDRKGHPVPGTSSMKTQFFCHWYAVRLHSPNKPSWDLDTKLPDTSMANEINHGCNYGSGASGEF